MKSKKLIVIFSILVFLTVLVVLSSTIFTLQNVSINWMTTKYKLLTIDDEQLTSDIILGKSIFLIDKEEITSNLEKKYPYLRVVGVETKFPNKIVIHSAEREVLFAVKKADDNYALLDEFGKVLENNKSLDSLTQGTSLLSSTPIKVDFQSLSLKEEDFVNGEIVKVAHIEKMISKLAYSFKESNYSPTTSKGVFQNIDILSDSQHETVNITTRRGIVIKLKDAEEYTTDKLLVGLARYNAVHNQGIVEYTIEVRYDSLSGRVEAS